jgi:hypothetical protein
VYSALLLVLIVVSYRSLTRRNKRS